MNQQQQDKAAFFAQYYPQNVMRHESYTDGPLIAAIPVGNTSHYLELKPLSAITDEEVFDMISIMCPTIDIWFNIREYADQMVAGFESERPVPGASFSDCVLAIDFFRSRGYLIPFRNYSTDQILEMGWAKLKDL